MFQLETVREVRFTNSNPRSEFHGEEHVRAIDIAMTIEGENTLLDLIEPGLREHEYTNRDLKDGQETLPDVVIPLPHRRFPSLPEKVAYAKGEKWRGYRFVIDYGIGGDSNVDLTDCALASVWYEVQEGGTVTIGFTVQYNGADLERDSLYGRLAALPSLGEGHVQLFAPPELLPVKKGWRSGKADEPTPTDKGAPLLETGPGDDDHDEDDTGNVPAGEFAEGSPEGALLESVQTDNIPASKDAAWPFPRENPNKRGRGKKAEATLQ